MIQAERDPVRIGVLGAGAITQVVHLPILTERADVRVVAISDRDDHKVRSVAQRFGIEHVVDDDTLVRDESIQGVLICTPNFLHEEQAVAALEAGKDVLVERPLALTADGARRVVEVARRTGGAVVAGMSHRFRPDVAALRAVVATGELGDIYAVRGTWLNRGLPPARSTWRQKPREAGGGTLMDLGVQALDLCLWIAGYPRARTVKAVTHRGAFEVEDAASLLVELEGGAGMTLDVSWGYFGAEDRHYARVLGPDGSGSLPPLEIFRQVGGRPLDVTPRQPTPRGGENLFTNAYRREIDHFVRVLAGEAEAPLPTDQVALVELVQAAYRSAREGAEVRLGPA